MDNRPVGIFDSGFGGLTAVNALRRLMPSENIIYFGDSSRAPYGVRPVSELRRMAVQDMEFVASLGVKAIIAACGTVSSTAADELDAYPLQVTGVLRSSVDELRREASCGPVGIIATEASIASGAFERAAAAACPERQIISAACQSFVALIESGHSGRDDRQVLEAVRGYLLPLREAGVKTLLLGCTHFGIIADAISDFMGEDTVLLSASDCAAKAMRDYLEKNGMTGGSGSEEYYTSGPVGQFETLASIFLGGRTARAVHVEPMEVKR